MDKNHDFLVESPFVRSMIMNDNKYAFDIIDISGEYEGRLNFLIKVTRGISYDRLISILKKCVKESVSDAFLLAFHLRDCRGGKGERLLGRKALQWLGINYPLHFIKILQLVPIYGRWDDLFVLFPHVVLLNRMDNYLSTNVDIEAFKNLQKMCVKLYASKLQDDIKSMKNGGQISLAAKWAPTENDKNDQQYELVDTLCAELGINKQIYRKQYISPLRKYTSIVENNLRTNTFHNIDYNKVPSVALTKYFKTFLRKDEIQFNLFLKKDSTQTYSTNVFPHDIVKKYDIYNATKSYKEVERLWTHFLGNYDNIFIEKCIPILHLTPHNYRKKQIACSFDSYTRVPSKMENMEAIIKERDDRSRSIYLDTRAKVTAFAEEALLDCSSVNSDFSQSTQPKSEGVLKKPGQKKRQTPVKSFVQSVKKVKRRRKR